MRSATSTICVFRTEKKKNVENNFTVIKSVNVQSWRPGVESTKAFSFLQNDLQILLFYTKHYYTTLQLQYCMKYCFINYASENFYFLNFTWVKELFHYFTPTSFVFFTQILILFVKYRMWMVLPLLLHFQTERSNRGTTTEQSKQQRAKCEFVRRSAAFHPTINLDVLLDKKLTMKNTDWT